MNDAPKLKPCPFCGSKDVHVRIVRNDDGMEVYSQIECYSCLTIFYYAEACCHEEQVEAWNRRAENEDEILEVHAAIYDEEETYPNCSVQILRNSVTGDVSVGWWPNEETEA